ncbi:uncharacterized protein LOC109851752 [Pseudomyrmex gracilis]|uniref:uncharacterized protein LOC109851752 n=1 Tax=Pseudomyrmex gracilis TaxID=219809 RepID=UPI000994A432|nr:uncharacterized protein LOC109851752 [Pseudomyrmex gracilis]
MPNENVPVCACGLVVPKTQSNSLVLFERPARKLTILLPKSKDKNKSEGKNSRKQQHDNGRGPKNRTSSETGSSSAVTERARSTMKSKHEQKHNRSRRAQSADRAESHYTYIDSGSSILGGDAREDTVPEVLYATIPDTPNTSNITETGTSRSNTQSRSQPLPPLPSMTSPPPTYDVAIAKTWQNGLPPTYEEYLCHKYAMMTRSHTPPPPWSESITTTGTTTTTAMSSSNPTLSVQARRDLLASPALREYLAHHLAHQSDRGAHYQQHQHQQQQRQQSRDVATYSSNLREQQQVRTQQRARAMPPR